MHVAIFGSAARGTADAYSDFDIIAVLEENELSRRETLYSELKDQFPQAPSISTYSRRRFDQLWKAGSPFAWHLYLEHKPLIGYDASLFNRTPPAEYCQWEKDIQSMSGVLETAFDSIYRGTNSPCFEAGLLYVCARNLGMFAALPIKGRFDFSRWAPYFLEPLVSFPITRNDYITLTRCRLASTRGLEAPRLDHQALVKSAKQIWQWSNLVRSHLNLS